MGGLTADLIVRHWRAWLAFAGLTSALASRYRHDWTGVAVAAVVVLVPVVWRVRAELLATREMLRESQSAGGKHRKPPQQPYTCSGCGAPGVTTWPSEQAAAIGQLRGLDLKCDSCLVGALRMVARSAG